MQKQKITYKLEKTKRNSALSLALISRLTKLKMFHVEH